MSHILITGGAGFIGFHVASKYLRDGHQVTIFDNLSTGNLDNTRALERISSSRDSFSFIRNSILNRAILDKAVKNSDCVIHLAAAVGVPYVLANPLLTVETNVRGTEIVLELCAKYNKRVLIASSSEVYGKQATGRLKEDKDCLIGPSSTPRWSYALTKLASECAAMSHFRENSLRVTIVRLFNTAGARQSGHYGMVIPRLLQQALNNQPLSVYGDGKQTRTFTDVTEVAKSISLLLQNDKAIGEIVNIGGVQEISIKSLAQTILNKTESSSPIEYVPYSKVFPDNFEDIQTRLPCTEKLRSLTKFTPKNGVDIILTKAINHYKKTLFTEYDKQVANL